MMRSMFSAVSGLRAHQTRMDVIGNNIANVNTVGFKGSRVTFQEVFSQTLRGAGAPQQGKGGTNPQQVGLGINIASMDTFHIRGAVERTDYNTDLMINGDGFFIVSDDNNFLNRSYTRAGNFSLDQAGNLVTADGYRVLGYMSDENGFLKTNLEGIVISKAVTFDAKATEKVSFEGNLNSELKVLPDNVTPLVGVNGVYEPKTKLNNDGVEITYYEVNSAYKDSVAREATFEVYDRLGGIHRIKQAFIKTGESSFVVETFYVRPDGSMVNATSGGNENISFEPDTPTVIFNSRGKWDAGEDNNLKELQLTIPQGYTNGAGALIFTVNYENLTMFANTSSASATKSDGYKQGTLDDFSISPTGEIMGSFDNGMEKLLGRIALANFKNPGGLEKTASNMYKVTSNSGEPMVGTPGSGGFGNINPGALEMSNVDLSREFTNMITTQRGFQANSRIISTSDEMLQELVNLKR